MGVLVYVIFPALGYATLTAGAWYAGFHSASLFLVTFAVAFLGLGILYIGERQC